MNLLFIISLFLTSINTLATLQGPCLTIVKRKEIRQLSPSELSKFINATLQLKQKGVLDEYSKIHLDHTEVAHNVGGFLPWHRYFLKQLELQLIQIDPSITLPYWDWTLDSQAPERSILFQPNYFGGNGDKQKNECISTSPYATWSMQVPSTHCLKRKFDLGDKISSFYSPEAIEAILRTSTTYDQFRKNIELIPHAKVHDNIGGDMTEMFSPNDPLFYLHHAFVDLLWFEWQKRFPGLAETYDSTIESILPPFNAKVGGAFNTMDNGLCYYYDRYGAQIPEVPNAGNDGGIEWSSNLNTNVNNNGNINNNINNNNMNSNINNNVNNNINNMDNPPRIRSRLPVRKPNKKHSKGLFGIINDISNTGLTEIVSDTIQDISRIIPIRVNYNDRTTKNKLRQVKPLSQEYIIKFGLDVNYIRTMELKLNNLVSLFNGIQGFIPKVNI